MTAAAGDETQLVLPPPPPPPPLVRAVIDQLCIWTRLDARAAAAAAGCDRALPTIFEIGETPRVITIEEYVQRIVKYAGTDPQTLVCAIDAIDALRKARKVCVTQTNVFKLMLTATHVMTKVYDEVNTYTNAYMALVGGVTLGDMNKLEIEFMRLCGMITSNDTVDMDTV